MAVQVPPEPGGAARRPPVGKGLAGYVDSRIFGDLAASNAAIKKMVDAAGIPADTTSALRRFADQQANLSRLGKQILGYQDFLTGINGQIGNIGSIGSAYTKPRPTKVDTFSQDTPDYTYSPELSSPADYFSFHEVLIDSFADLTRVVSDLAERNPDLALVWRGVRSADWGLHSSLYRRLMLLNNVTRPQQKPVGPQPFPEEEDMVRAEFEILRIARTEWRLGDLAPLEIFARIQHYGGPTRLLDVSRSALVAAWFAVEASEETEDADARLFALATRSLDSKGVPTPVARIEEEGSNAPLPFWMTLTDSTQRDEAEWGTGARRRVWVPPEYERRIAAQNAAFVLDGVPVRGSKFGRYFKQSNGRPWKRADLLASSSIYTKTYSPERSPRPNQPRFSPSFTFRITSRAKVQIRQTLERAFGYNQASIYPDISALASELNQRDLSTSAS